jgi:hypothetical protein
MVLRAGVNAVKKRKILFLLGLKPRPSSPQPVAILTELPKLHFESLGSQ